jgi:deoxyribodipyrimidine photo-lyase
MSADAAPTLWWVRRDLRLADNPALRRGVDDGDGVLPLFVLDPALLAGAGTARRAWLFAALHALDRELRDAGGPGLHVRSGRPLEVVPATAAAVGAREVHVAADFAPYGRRRDVRVAAALARSGAQLIATGSPYAVAPGALRNGSGTPFQVFTPFHRAWQAHGVHGPAPDLRAGDVSWLAADGGEPLPTADEDLIPLAGERPAVTSWRNWLRRENGGADDYKALHNLPAADATSRLSIALRWGHLHPRTVLADLGTRTGEGAAAVARQIAWRDFFADVLFNRPEAVREPIRREFRAMDNDEPDGAEVVSRRLRAWQQGRTGFPLVDAGMRQLLAEGWMHNRVRMVVASFLIKDLHIGWWHGADWFMDRLRDGDIAQNQLNWQWVAGCGTDAAPYFRIFNPSGQAEKFDADGRYIKRFVPELADVPVEHIHQPWNLPGGPPADYPAPIVDHADERREALRRYAELRAQR